MLQFEENDQATKVNSNTFIPKPNIVRIDYNKVLSALHTHTYMYSLSVAVNFLKQAVIRIYYMYIYMKILELTIM